MEGIITKTVGNREYRCVVALQDGCHDCVVDAKLETCRVLREYAPSSKTHWCDNVVWIHNNPEACAAHAVKLMESL